LNYSVFIREGESSHFLRSIERLLRQVDSDLLKDCGLLNRQHSKDEVEGTIRELSAWLWATNSRSEIALKQLHRESLWGNDMVDAEYISTQAEVELVTALSILHGVLQAHEMVSFEEVSS